MLHIIKHTSHNDNNFCNYAFDLEDNVVLIENCLNYHEDTLSYFI